MTSVRYVFSWIAMFAVIGFLFWILNEIRVLFRPYGETGDVLTLANFLWDGSLLIIAVLSIFWLLRKMKEWEVVR